MNSLILKNMKHPNGANPDSNLVQNLGPDPEQNQPFN